MPLHPYAGLKSCFPLSGGGGGLSRVDMYFNWNVERQMFVSGKLMLTAEVTPAGKDKYCGAGYDWRG